MAGKTIIRGQKARKLINTGIQIGADTVSSTFGPRGRTVAFNKGTNTVSTKDGISVLKKLESSDEAIDMGFKLLKEAADKANMHSGDGSTSTAILTGALCDEAFKLLSQGIDINDLRVGYKKAATDVLKKLPGFKKDVDDEQIIYNIALVSANGDEEIATFVKDAFTKIGDGGIVSYADSMSRTGQTFLDVKQGIQLDKGYISSKCVNTTNDQCVLNDAKIIIFNDVVDDTEKLSLLLQTINKKPTLVVAPDYSQEVIAYYTKSYAASPIVFIRADGISYESVKSGIIDLAVLTSAKIIGIDKTIEEFNVSKDAGFAKEIIINGAKQTIISEPKTDEAELEKHIKQLKDLISGSDCVNGLSPFQIEQIENRIARMTGGIATIYIGALTSIELGEKKDRYDDAINAVKNSLEEGFLVGAGTSLLLISYDNEMTTESCANMTIPQSTAYKAFMKAIRAPAKRLITSTGEDTESIIPLILATKDVGFNARTAKVENIAEKGIVDPMTTLKNSIIYSSNMAEQFMSIDTIIISDVKNMSVEPLDDIVDPGRMFN